MRRASGSTYRFLQNIMGMWLVQQSRAAWAKDGQQYDYPELAALAEEGKAFRCWINPNDLRFYAPANMVARSAAGLRRQRRSRCRAACPR